MLSDLPLIYLFWLVLFIIGFINLPLTFLLFKNFIDRGYIFSKILSLALTSYTVWLLSGLKILPFTQISIMAVLIVFALINLVIYRVLKQELSILTFSNLKIFLFEEVLFGIGFTFWSYIRGFAPDIRGLEKFMDFGFVNSILRTRFMPPLDMWLATSPDYPYHHINYYYFGHYVTAFLTKISGIAPEMSYNLMLGVLFAFTFTGSFSIALNLFATFQRQSGLLNKILYNRRTILCGLIAGFFVALGGNLHTIYAFTKGYPLDHPIPFWQVLGKPSPNTYWYPNATRFIPNTIHEFPIYSFVVSDLHGHVLDIPFVLLTIAFLFSILLSDKTGITEKLKAQSSKLKTKAKNLNLLRFRNLTSGLNIYILRFEIILLGLLLVVMYMTNAWDGIIYLGLAGLVLLIINTKLKNNKEPSQPEIQNSKIKNQNYSLKLKIIDKEISFEFLNFIFIFSFLLFTFFLFSFPFNRHFIPFAKGIGINCFTPNATGTVLCDHSPLWMMIILWGHFYYFSISFLIFAIIPTIKSYFSSHSSNSKLHCKMQNYQNLTTSDVFIILLILLSTLLLIAPEFIFARDIYPAHYRANTMFKLGYQAFIMLGLTISYILLRFLTISPFQKVNQTPSFTQLLVNKLERVSWWFFALIQLLLVSIYPFFAINSYYNGLREYQTLDGLFWLKKYYPGDYEAVYYFKDNLSSFDQPTILEAVGDSYTDYARISANTGLPTILGWPVHEWLWRGSFNEAGKRQEEVRNIYEASNPEEAKNLLQKYKVEYVIIGQLEREKYPRLNEENFLTLGKLIFSQSGTRIYKLN